jgi:hypothetical protein
MMRRGDVEGVGEDGSGQARKEGMPKGGEE